MHSDLSLNLKTHMKFEKNYYTLIFLTYTVHKFSVTYRLNDRHLFKKWKVF